MTCRISTSYFCFLLLFFVVWEVESCHIFCEVWTCSEEGSDRGGIEEGGRVYEYLSFPIHTHPYTRMFSCTHALIYTSSHTHMTPYACRHTHVHTSAYTHSLIHITSYTHHLIHTCPHTHMTSYTHILIHA